MSKLFLDSTVIISALTSRNPASVLIIIEPKSPLFTNEYVIKEVRRILGNEFKFTVDEVNRSIDFMRDILVVLPMPNKNEFKKIQIEDKSDKPIVYSAKKSGCILVTEDRLLYQNAKKYVQTLKPEELRY